MDMSYSIRNNINGERNKEEYKYGEIPIDLINNNNNSSNNNSNNNNSNNNINASYLMNNNNGTILTNANATAYNSDCVINRDNYPTADLMSQIKLNQNLSNYNTLPPLINMNFADNTDMTNMQSINTNADTIGFEQYKNLLNYNSAHNNIRRSQIPMTIDDYNNNNITTTTNNNNNNNNTNSSRNGSSSIVYINPNTGETIPHDYINNLSQNEQELSSFSGAFKFPNGNFNSMINTIGKNAFIDESDNDFINGSDTNFTNGVDNNFMNGTSVNFNGANNMNGTNINFMNGTNENLVNNTNENLMNSMNANFMNSVNANFMNGTNANFMNGTNANHMNGTSANFNNLLYSMPVFENMNNPQMYMQSMNKNTMVNSPTPKIETRTTLRSNQSMYKKKLKQKRFFPCC